MTKEQYQELLTKPEIPMDLWYEFFIEMGGTNIDLGTFANMFLILTRDGETPVSGTDGEIKWVSLASAQKKFHEHYHKLFGL